MRSGAKNSVSDEATASTQRALAHQRHVAVAGEAHARQHAPAARHLLAVEADRLGEPQPQREPARRPAASPSWSWMRRIHARRNAGSSRLGEDERVLDGDARLVVVAVQHPGLQLRAGQLARVHALVERVLVVVAARPLARAGAATNVIGGRAAALVAHSSSSRPSWATSTPAAATARALGRVLAQDRVGVVDVDVERAAGPARASSCRLPSGPPIGQCAMSSARARAEAGGDQLVARPERAVEEHDVRLGQRLLDRRATARATPEK